MKRSRQFPLVMIDEEGHTDDGRMEELIIIAARWIAYDAPLADIRARLIKEGATEEEAFLAYAAGKIYERHC